MTASIAARLEPYKGHMVLLKKDQRTPDIIRAVMEHHKKYAPEYDRISEDFWTGDIAGTCKKLYDYCRANIKYKVESDDAQSVRSPGAMLKLGNGDCKHYASFINGVLDSLHRKGYPVKSAYRFASFHIGDPDPHHVFVVAKDGSKDLWIDPIPERRFNQHKQPLYFTDKTPSMALYSISGVGKPHPKKQQRKAKRQQHRSARKARRKERPKGKLFAKATMAIPRNSFNLVLKMNLLHWASKLKKSFKKDPAAEQKIKNAWKRLGGNPAVLMRNINQGVRVWNRHHPKQAITGITGGYDLCPMGWDRSISGVYLGQHIGIIPIAAGAGALVAALPVIKKLASVLKSVGINPAEAQEKGAAAAEAMDNQAAAQQEQQEPDQQTETDPGGDIDDTAELEDFQDDSDYTDPGEYEQDTGDISGIGLFNRKKKKKIPGGPTAKKHRPLISFRRKKKPASTPGNNQPRKIKIKTKNVTRPFISLQPGANNMPTAVVDRKRLPDGSRVLHLKDTSYNDAIEAENAGPTDSHNFFDNVKSFAITHKTPLLITGGAIIAIPLIRSLLINSSAPKKRRR